MDELRRLTQGGGDPATADLTRQLIGAVRDEQPEHAALQRALTAVSVGSAVLGATASTSAAAGGASGAGVGAGSAAASAATGAGAGTAGAAAGTATGTALAGKIGGLLGASAVKWISVAAVGGAVAIGAGSLLPPRHPSAPQDRQASAAAQSAKLAAAPVAPTQTQVPREVPPPEAVAPTPESAREAPRSGSAARDEGNQASQLTREVALVDQAREALASGQPRKALDRAQQYLAAFPRGHLLPEALFLQMEAQHGLGQSAAAAHSARRLLAFAPGSPQAERARELLDSPP